MNASTLPADAIPRFEQYAKIDPTNIDLLIQLSDLYHQSGRFDDALACLERCERLGKDAPKIQSRKASVLISQHRFVEAEAILAAMVAAGDQNAALQHNLGLTLYFQQRFDEARRHFQTAVERGLNVPGNYAYLARSLHHLGEMEAAIAAGQKWVQIAPSTESMSYLALLHIDGGDVAESNRLGLEVLRHDPENVDANVAVGSATMEQQQSERARQCFQTALKRDPDNGRAWLGMGLVRMYDREIPQAIEALGNAARIFPDNAGIAVTLAWSHIVNGDPTSAERAFERAIEVDRTFSEAHAGHAASLALLGKKDLARAALDLARRLNRHSFGLLLAESFLSAAENKQEASTAALQELLSRRPREDMLPLIDQLRIYSFKHGGQTSHKKH